MKYKIICEINIPLYEKVVDLNIPINKTVYYVCNMIDKLIIEEIDSNYVPKDTSLLIDKKTGIAYDKNVLVKNSGIKSGYKLTYY